MGYVRHHAIIVTGVEPHIYEARATAEEIFRRMGSGEFPDDRIAAVTEVTESTMNGYQSFMVAPDGSKEWWDHSDRGNEARAEFIKWLKEDGGMYWAEVQFADDDGINEIVECG